VQRFRREVRDEPREEWRVQETREPKVSRVSIELRLFVLCGSRHGPAMIPVPPANKQS
jgi:hypothetical protein